MTWTMTAASLRYQQCALIDKLIYNDIYDVVDSRMSDSNVGGRRGRNIRDNLFMINGIINYAIQEQIDIDINLYDLKKCLMQCGTKRR